jgi:hypothetical protein
MEDVFNWILVEMTLSTTILPSRVIIEGNSARPEPEWPKLDLGKVGIIPDQNRLRGHRSRDMKEKQDPYSSFVASERAPIRPAKIT